VNVTLVGGAGGVGASVAFNLVLSGTYDVTLVDPRREMVTSHLMDLEQVLELCPGSTIGRGDESDVAGADIVVLTASVPLTVNTSRLVHLEENGAIADAVASLLPDDWSGVLLVVTNPVDPLVTRVHHRTGIDRRRILGYTLNDSLRLRTGLARALGAQAGEIEAWVVGEHGDACVSLLDRVERTGRATEPTPAQAEEATTFLRTWYRRHVALDSQRSSTWTSGLGIARMIGAIASRRETVWPASVVLAGEYGIEGVAVGVPTSLGPGGAERIHEWPLPEERLSALQRSAEQVRAVTASIAGMSAATP
jgi:malate dehydrogenase